MRSGVVRHNATSLRPWIFVLPIIAVHTVVVAGPAIGGLYYSLTDWSGLGGAQFVGLDNYRRAASDPDVAQAFVNNGLYIAGTLVIGLGLALLAAGWLAPVRRGGLALRLAIFLPFVLPTVVVTQAWRLLLSPTQGVGALLANAGIPGFDLAYLGDPATAIYAIIAVALWQNLGFFIVVFLAAMQSIPVPVYEAARLDGATRWQEFRFLTLPMIRPTVAFMVLMNCVWGIAVFDYIWILTKGGPAGATSVLSVLVYSNGVVKGDAGYGAAIGIAMTVLAAVVILIYQALGGLRREQ